MKTLALLPCLLLAACAPQPVPSQPPDQINPSPCGPTAFTIRAQLAAPVAMSAKLSVRRYGEGWEAERKKTCLVAYEQHLLLQSGEAGEIEIEAHPHEIQKIIVEGQTYLIWIPPGGELEINDHPCFNWMFNAAWLDPHLQEPPVAYCRDPDEECWAGYAQAGPPGPIEDSLCETHHPDGDSERRCVREAGVRFPVDEVVDEVVQIRQHGEVTRYFPVTPIMPPVSCNFPRLRLGKETVWLAIGAGAHWTVWTNEHGNIQARAEELHVAALDGETARVEALLREGMQVNARSFTGETPLLNACGEGHEETVRLLLERGADVQAPDNDGRTPLHLVAGIGNLGLVKLLVDKGAAIGAKDHRGRTPVDMARDRQREEIVRYLENKDRDQ